MFRGHPESRIVRLGLMFCVDKTYVSLFELPLIVRSLRLVHWIEHRSFGIVVQLYCSSCPGFAIEEVSLGTLIHVMDAHAQVGALKQDQMCLSKVDENFKAILCRHHQLWPLLCCYGSPSIDWVWK